MKRLEVNVGARAWVFSPNHTPRLTRSVSLQTSDNQPRFTAYLACVPSRLCLVSRTELSKPNANPASSPCSSPTSIFETITMCPPGILGGLQSAGTMCASALPVNNQLKELYSDIINVFKPIFHFPAEIPAKCTLQQTLK